MPNDPQARRGIVHATRHPLADRGDDCYETPPCAVEALLKAVHLPQVIWEPACGPGSIVRVLRGHGHTVIANDIRDYGCPHSAVADFFDCTNRPPELIFRPNPVRCIVTNPPFKDAQRFIEHALELCDNVYMLGRLAWLESKRRTGILENGRLAKVLVFRNRLPMMHRRGWDGPKDTSAIAYAWFCWAPLPATYEPTTLERISWE